MQFFVHFHLVHSSQQLHSWVTYDPPGFWHNFSGACLVDGPGIAVLRFAHRVSLRRTRGASVVGGRILRGREWVVPGGISLNLLIHAVLKKQEHQ